MARRWIALGGTAAVLAGCGGPSEQQRSADQARYARASDAVCREDVNRANYGALHATTYLLLNSYAISVRQGLEIDAAKLHRLKRTLGDSTTAQIDAFDRALDPFTDSLKALDAVKDADAAHRAAARIRARGDRLFRAAQAAKLTDCGRGGNAIADKAETVVYAVGFRRIDETTQRRLKPLIRRFDRAAAGSGTQLIASDRITRAYRIAYRGLGRLDPPRPIRVYHQDVRRRLRDVLELRERKGTLSYAAFQRVRDRLKQRADKYYRAEQRLLRKLNG